MKKENGGPAYPAHIRGNTGTDTVSFSSTSGMSLRDYFAAKAMQGLIHSFAISSTIEYITALSYSYADAMLEEREK